jgi:hypothetical protein
MTKRINQETVEAAIVLHELLVGKQRHTDSISLPTYTWTNIQTLQRQIDTAWQRGWHGAAKRLREDMVLAVSDCRRQLDDMYRRLEDAGRTPCHKLTAADVYHDLVALKNEFEEVDIDLEKKELSVTTDSIVLDEVFLGPFQIRLEWQHIGQSSQPYRVVALDPHPATKSNEITHPHVQDERLCEGDGRAAIAAALAEGRLFDFFLLVSQLLHNYGRGSAYVELDHWDGEPCSDCGSYVDEDDRYYCHRCDTVLCDGCSHTCQGCDESFCSGCLSTCSVCCDEFCSACLESCQDCRKRVCDECCEEGHCRHCHQKQQEENEHDATEDDLQQEPVATSV